MHFLRRAHGLQSKLCFQRALLLFLLIALSYPHAIAGGEVIYTYTYVPGMYGSIPCHRGHAPYVRDREAHIQVVAGGGAGSPCTFNNVYPWTSPLNPGGGGGGSGASVTSYLPPQDNFECGYYPTNMMDHLSLYQVGYGGGDTYASSQDGEATIFCFEQDSPITPSMVINVCCELDGGKAGQGNTGGQGGGFGCRDVTNAFPPHVNFAVAYGGNGGTVSSPTGAVGSNYTHYTTITKAPAPTFTRIFEFVAGSGGGYGGSLASPGGHGGRTVTLQHGQGYVTAASGGGGGGSNFYSDSYVLGNLTLFDSTGACVASSNVQCATDPIPYAATYGGGGRGGCNDLSCAPDNLCVPSVGGAGRAQLWDRYWDATPPSP